MNEAQSTSPPIVRFLFLGDPLFDRRVQNFIRFYIKKGYQAELCYGAASETELEIQGCRLIHIPVLRHSGPSRFLSYNARLRSAIDLRPPTDILFACDLYSLRAASRLKASNTILIYDAREIYTKLPTTENKILSRLFWKRWESRGLRQTDIIVTTAPLDGDAIKAIHSFLPTNIVVKNMPLSERPIVRRLSLRGHFDIPASKSIVVYVGGLQKGRGLEMSIRAIKQLPDAALVLIGDGVFKADLAALAAQEEVSASVFFYGTSPADEVLSLLESANVGISLIERTTESYTLALPSKIFEYLRAGLPVISSPLGQVQRSLGKRPYVFYADENNDHEIVRALRDAIALSHESAVRAQIADGANREFVFEHDAELLCAEIDHRTR